MADVPVKLPDLTADSDKALNDTERALLKLARTTKEANESLDKFNKAKMGVGVKDALDALSKWKQGILASAAAETDRVAKSSVLGIEELKAAQAKEAAAKKLVGAIGAAETGLMGFAGGLMLAAKAVDEIQKFPMTINRTATAVAAAAQSGSKDLVDSLADVAIGAAQWGQSQQQVMDEFTSIMSTRSKGVEGALMGLEGTSAQGGTKLNLVMDQMTKTFSQSGMSVSAQFDHLRKELMMGTLQFSDINNAIKDANQTILDMNDASAATHTEFQLLHDNVMDVTKELRVFGAEPDKITRQYMDFSQAIQQGTMNVSQFTAAVGGFAKQATPQQMLQFGKLAASWGGKAGERFADIGKKAEKEGWDPARLTAAYREEVAKMGKEGPAGMQALLRNFGQQMHRGRGRATAAEGAEALGFMGLGNILGGTVTEQAQFLGTNITSAKEQANKLTAAATERQQKEQARGTIEAGRSYTTTTEQAGIQGQKALYAATMGATGGKAETIQQIAADTMTVGKAVFKAVEHPVDTVRQLVQGEKGYISKEDAEKMRHGDMLKVQHQIAQHLEQLHSAIKDGNKDRKEGLRKKDVQPPKLGAHPNNR